MHTRELFDAMPLGMRSERLAPGAWLLRGFALDQALTIMAAIEGIEAAAPFRHLTTPGGFRMSVAMTNCGSLGWVSDSRGYRYEPGARLTLHQDKDERDCTAPIVSVSLGLPAVFLFGGNSRKDRQRRLALQHGDVVVWGGPARLYHHGVLALKDGHHDVLGSTRLNLTFRRAG